MLRRSTRTQSCCRRLPGRAGPRMCRAAARSGGSPARTGPGLEKRYVVPGFESVDADTDQRPPVVPSLTDLVVHPLATRGIGADQDDHRALAEHLAVDPV